MTEARMMTVAEVADYSSRHSKTVLRALRRGELLGYQRAVNGSWRVYVEDVDRWMHGAKPRPATALPPKPQRVAAPRADDARLAEMTADRDRWMARALAAERDLETIRKIVTDPRIER